jgi:SOS-response transcriptional repressor LexA
VCGFESRSRYLTALARGRRMLEMLKSSHEFDTLPSERHSNGRSKAEELLRNLAEYAYSWSLCPSDRSGKARRLRERVQRGEAQEVPMCFETQPGAFIEKESERVREILRTLRSEDAQDLAGLRVEGWEAEDPNKMRVFSHTQIKT